MPTKAEYKAKREARRRVNKQRAAKLRKWLPLVEVLCKQHGIAISEIPSGYQFRMREYILNWWLPTNKIVVQYVGSDYQKAFDSLGAPGEPKIMVALKKLVHVTQDKRR